MPLNFGGQKRSGNLGYGMAVSETLVCWKKSKSKPTQTKADVRGIASSHMLQCLLGRVGGIGLSCARANGKGMRLGIDYAVRTGERAVRMGCVAGRERKMWRAVTLFWNRGGFGDGQRDLELPRGNLGGGTPGGGWRLAERSEQ